MSHPWVAACRAGRSSADAAPCDAAPPATADPGHERGGGVAIVGGLSIATAASWWTRKRLPAIRPEALRYTSPGSRWPRAPAQMTPRLGHIPMSSAAHAPASAPMSVRLRSVRSPVVAGRGSHVCAGAVRCSRRLRPLKSANVTTSSAVIACVISNPGERPVRRSSRREAAR